MEENKNTKEIHNNLTTQAQSYNINSSLNSDAKNNSNNNTTDKEKDDYKSYLKKNDRSLYELFSSELFTIELLIDYLIHKEDPNIIDFLIDILYNRFQNNILYYLPQLCSLTICKAYFNPIESFIINHSSDDLKFAVSANWIYESFIQDNFTDHKKKQFIKFIESLEEVMINGPKNKKISELNQKFYLEKEDKLEQFVNTLNFYSKLNRVCLRLKELKPDLSLDKNNSIPISDILKKTRKKYLREKIKIFNDEIIKTFKKNKGLNSYCGIILPFEQKSKKIIVHILEKYSFFFATKERIPLKLTMECIDSDELNENIVMNKDFLSNNVESTNDNEFESNNNMMGMDSDERKKEYSKKNTIEINKILETIKYYNDNPKDEQMKNNELNIIEDKPQINQGNQNFDVKQIFKPWSETEKKIKEDSYFKDFKSLSIISFIIKANDDLRQEAMTMQLIKKYDELFKKENIPLKLHPYEIIVTSNSGGLIEFINDTISFDALKKKLLENNLTFTEFFEKYFGDDFEEGQKNFAESLAGYSLVCYLLSIKDRHNGNILLSKDGSIIHIDFGFILGISPGGNLNFENAPFKITKDYVNLMGGVDSSIFCYFKSLFIRGLFVARKNMDIIANLIEGMGVGVAMPCFNGRNLKEIISNFKERCFFRYSEAEIVPQVNNLFDKAVNSWRTTQYDYFQKLSNGIQP
jgi:phosphatidylinositol 4-kinase